MTLRLDQTWVADSGTPHGAFRFRLTNLGTEDLAPARFCYSSMTRVARDAAIAGGRLERTFANHVEIALDRPLPAGGALDVTVDGLTHKPTNRTQGAMAAWLELADGGTVTAEVADLVPPDGTDRGPGKSWPEGRVDLPLGVIPWPAEIAVVGWRDAPILGPAPGADPAAFATVAALHRRLFPAEAAPIVAAPAPGALAVETAADPGLPPGGYRIDFGPTLHLAHADADGLRHGLVTLAQAARAARADARFRFPAGGHIADAPRFGWRGCHLDVARNFRPAADVARLVDILAWLKMNRFHWHLTDDEGWRLPSKAFPELSGTAATRARGTPLTPQYADGPDGQRGTYTESEVRGIVTRATALGVAVMPDLDMPGHVTALLSAVDGLRDPGEPADSYRSIQGYPNNALNPALERTYEVVETLLREAAELFPGAMLHVGADEVDENSWRQSPEATALANRERLNGTHELQAYFLRRVQGIVRGLGREMGGWDECAEGGGVDPDGTLLFAWRNVAKTAELIERGYDVVATPGQAYYLDMIESGGWDAAGTSWAGVAGPETTYRFEPAEGLPDGPGRLRGVQACIWSEHLDSLARLNAIVFPRLAAVAEAAWTPRGAKDWDRFCALSRLVPQL